jgi:adhesin transport system outer membrane protein
MFYEYWKHNCFQGSIAQNWQVGHSNGGVWCSPQELHDIRRGISSMLKKFLLTLSVSTALSASVCAQAETISDSVTQAILSHPQMKAGEASLAAADKNIQEQRSGFFPELAVNGGAGRMHLNDDTTRGNTASDGGAASWVGEGSVTLTQPIFSGFSVVDRVHSAKDRAAAATYDLSGTAEDIALRAARAHLNLMRTKELLDLASQFLNNIKGRRKNIALMVKEGAADAAELLQANEIQAAVENTKLGYEESFHQAEADYIEVVGAGPSGKLEFGEESWNALVPATLDEAVTYAVSRNARVLAAGSLVSALSMDADAEKSSLMPHVDAEMSYSHKDQSDVVGGESVNGQAMLRMGWNFSTGGGQIARIGKLQQLRDEACAKKQGVIRTVEHDVRQKFTSMEIVDQQYALLVDREKASKKILENFQAQFEGGKQSNLQLISAHSKVFEAGAARIDAYYRRLLSRFELLNASGKLREAFADVKPAAPKADDVKQKADVKQKG